MYNEEVVRVLMKRQKGIHPCFIIAVALDPRFKHIEGYGVLTNEVDNVWNKVLNFMIAFKSSDNGNGITASVSKVNNDAAAEAPVTEGNQILTLLELMSIIIVEP